jgi:kynurenine formamidase
MKSLLLTKCLFLTMLFAGSIVAVPSKAQTKNEGPWWPHKLWGAADQSGGSNWITPEKIVKALALVKTGKVFELGHPYERGMPMPGQRSYNIFIPSFPTYAPAGKNKVVFNDEYITSEIGQVGTQFDGPGHVGRQMTMADGSIANVFYNGVNGEEMKNPYGLQKLGVENVKPIITRAILIDLAAYKGVNTMPENYEITVADIRNTLTRQGMSESDIEPGDAILFNLGWWRIWPDKKTVQVTAAFAGHELIDWLIQKKPCVVGSDASLDVGPDYLLHEELILKNGIFNLEYMNFESLVAEKQQYKFLFIVTPLRLKGATGSPARPLAIY